MLSLYVKANCVAIFACVALSLTGCAGGGPFLDAPAAGSVARLQGQVHGGQQPVSGASIQVWAVGTTGDGSAATPLLATPAISDVNGDFNLTGLYACAPNALVYITGTGGNPGLSGGTNNPQLALMVAAGTCSQLQAMSFLTINELTTVAAVSELAPYMNGYSQVGSAANDLPQLQAAFADAALLVDPGVGVPVAVNLPTGATVDTTLINTLGNILAYCVNSPGGFIGDGSACGTLFADTLQTGTAGNADTIAAMMNLARYPTSNVQNLVFLQPATAPFQPSYSTAPSALGLQVMRAGLVAIPSSTYFGSTYYTINGVGYLDYTPKALTILNNSSVAVNITGHGVSSTTPSNFSVGINNRAYHDWDCPAQLAPGATCTWNVKFNATTTAAENGVYQIENDSSVPVLSIPAVHAGLPQKLPDGTQLAFTPSSLNLDLYPGSGNTGDFWSGTATATLTNQTVNAIAFSKPVLSYTSSPGTDVAINAGTCNFGGGWLQPGASCTYTISLLNTYIAANVKGTVFVNDVTNSFSSTVSFSTVYH